MFLARVPPDDEEISYSICQDCYEDLMREIEFRKRGAKKIKVIVKEESND
jgi:hypothetical protein